MSHNYGGYGDGRPKQLSATAPEFVPRGYAQQQPQNGLGPGQGMPGASLFLQQQQQQLALQQHMQMLQQQQHQQQQQQQQQQQRMNRQQPNPYTTHGGPPGPPHYYQQHGGPQHYQSQPGPQRGGHSQNHRGGRGGQAQQPSMQAPQDPMAQLKQAILILTKDPGMFDDAMPDLTSSLAANIETEDKLIQMVEEIFRQSVEEANFRYTGARVCNYFSHHLTVQFNSGNFRQHLLKRCHREHEKRDDLVKSCDNRYKLVGFTLFMAELLLNLTVGSSHEYMNIIANAVQELITSLLSQPADDTIRCVVQVLKLCGGVLEDSEKSRSEDQSTPRLDSVFIAIKQFVLETSYHKGMRGQMLSVIELRAADWNRRDSDNSSKSSAPDPSNSAAPAASSGPQMAAQQPQQPPLNYNASVPVNPAGMYYGDPSRQPESVIPPQFSQQQAGAGFYPDDIYYYSSGEEDWQNQEEYIQHYMYNGVECIQEDDMDPEIAAAFNDFLQNQQQQQQ